MYSNEIKMNAVMAFCKGDPVTVIVQKFQIGSSTIYSWLKIIGYNSKTKQDWQKCQDYLAQDRKAEVLSICRKEENKSLYIFRYLEKKVSHELEEEIAISKRIKLLMRSHNYKKAMYLCELPFSLTRPVIQSQRITLLMILKQFDEALKVCDFPEFKKDAPIQSQKVTILISLGKLTEALEICNFPEFKHHGPIQSQKVTILISLAQWKEALEICNSPEFKNNAPIQSQKVTILMSLEQWKEALEICDFPEFKNNASIQSQKVTILLSLSRIKEALEICDFPEFKHHGPIQSQKVTILISLGKLTEALEICNSPEFKNNAPIQSQKVTILMSLAQWKEALEICNSKEFQTNLVFQAQKALVLEAIQTNESKDQSIDNILSKIYSHNISLQDIADASLVPSWDKILLTCAYYNLFNREAGMTYIKTQLTSSDLTSSQQKTLKACFEQIANKKKIFDITYYNKLLLGKSFIFYPLEPSKKSAINEVKSAKEPVKKESKPVTSVRQIPKESKQCPNVSNPTRPKSLKNIKNQKKVTTIYTLREYFLEDILKLEKEIYVLLQTDDIQLQKKAIKAWDILENISSKPITDLEAYDKLLTLFSRLNRTVKEMKLIRK